MGNSFGKEMHYRVVKSVYYRGVEKFTWRNNALLSASEKSFAFT